MGNEIVKIISTTVEIAEILAGIFAADRGDRKQKAFATGDVFSTELTGDVEWSSYYYYGFGYNYWAYNPTDKPVALTFTKTTPDSCTTDIVDVDPLSSTMVSDYFSLFSQGYVTAAPTQPGDDGVPAPAGLAGDLASFVVRELGLGVPATVFPNVDVIVNGGVSPSLEFTLDGGVVGGSFTATLLNGEASATVAGNLSGGLIFPLPSFLSLNGETIDHLQVEMALQVGADFDRASRLKPVKSIKGRPQGKRKLKQA